MPRIEKVVLNIGCGGKINVNVAKALLEKITGAKSVVTLSRKRTTFGGAPGKGKAIGVKVTIRARNDASKLLKLLLAAKNNVLRAESFDETGNVCFGVREYTDIPTIEYDPNTPPLGMDVCVSLERPGYRIKRKSVPFKIGKRHLLDSGGAKKFMENAFGIKIEEKGVA
jgi:large subunit ribosomal protein L5